MSHDNALAGGPAAPRSFEASPAAAVRTARIGVYASALLVCVAWALLLGKDVHWDAVNYHLYLGFSAVNDRFANDFFAAGTPSYVNPYAYVPLYLMDAAGLSAMGIAIALASLHATIIWVVFELALLAGRPEDRAQHVGFAVLAAVLAFLSPVFLQGVGATMVDIPTGALVVGGWLAMAQTIVTGRSRGLIIAGLLCGAAAALKLSNALYAMAAVAMLPFLRIGVRRLSMAMLAYCTACAAAFIVVSWPWSFRLWSEFGNPFFPFFNQLFASPDFTTAPLIYERFLPLSWLDGLLRPFAMLSATSMVHTEARAADLRFAALLAIVIGWLLFESRSWRVAPAAQDDERLAEASSQRDRVLPALIAALTVAWVLWLTMSGNSRYFIPMGCIAGVVIAVIGQRFYCRWRGATLIGTVLLISAQTILIALGSDWRRDGAAWEGPWLRTAVADRFRNEPHLFLSTAFLSGSALLPYLHPESGMINISGFYAIGPGRAGGSRAQALVDRNIGRARILTMLPRGVHGRATLPGPPNNLDVFVRRFGLRVDATDCEFLAIEGNLRGSAHRQNQGDHKTTFMTCRLEAAPESALAYARDVGPIDMIFDRVEATCPNLFHPARPLSEQYPKWARLYNMGSEVQLWIEGGRVLYSSPSRGGGPVDIGSVQAWMESAQPFDCSRRVVRAVIDN